MTVYLFKNLWAGEMVQWIKHLPPKHKDQRQAGMVATCHHSTWKAETWNAQNKPSVQTRQNQCTPGSVRDPASENKVKNNQGRLAVKCVARHMHVHYDVHPHSPNMNTHTQRYRKKIICSFVSFCIVCILSVLLYISEEILYFW